MTTSRRSRERIGLGSISSLEASPAKTSATQAKEQDSLASEADCSMNSAVWLAKWDQDTLSWRTSQRCLLGGWIKFLGRWPRSGTMRNGTAYRLQPLVPRITAIESSSLLPTPTARDYRGGHKGTDCVRKRTPNGHGCQLNDLVDGPLNPTFVEWVMGFPIGWTDLEDSETQ